MTILQPGRELDALIAEKVMGFKRFNQPPDYDGNYGGEPVLFPPGMVPEKSGWQWPPKGKVSFAGFSPHYSTSIEEAWWVVERMRQRMCCFFLKSDGTACWECYGITDMNSEEHNNPIISQWNVYICVETAPHAICLAALKAMEVETNP